MASLPPIDSARTVELAPALRLLFQHIPADEREMRVGNALRLIQQGELDPAGVFVARDAGRLLGSMVVLPVPGASALVWPPQTLGGRGHKELEDQLVRHASAWLRQRGARLAQALLMSNEAYLAASLERNGFVHITSLWYLRHHLIDLPLATLAGKERLTYQSFDSAPRDLFEQTLLATYEQTLDCPEVNGVRTVEQIMEGHASQGRHDPDRWWLALSGRRPVGVLLVTELPEWNAWDLSYVGVVPAARGRGLGRELVCKALFEARAAEAAQLTLSVDMRNRPARNLYQRLDFEPCDEREVYLAIWR